MRQYRQMKAKNPDAVLLFRMGDFFETFEDDAIITAKVCGITLTKRNNGDAGDVPLAGFPHHQLDAYLPKLVRAGHRVAVCEQIEDPKMARGIVRRDVVEVVTPGIGLYDKLLDARRNRYVASIAIVHEKTGMMRYGFACADISTGEFFTTEIASAELLNIIELCAPSEIVIAKGTLAGLTPFIEELSQEPAITKLENWIFEEQFGRDVLLRHFRTVNLKGFGIEHLKAGIMAAGAVLHYIHETQKAAAVQISRIALFSPSDYMMLDYATRRNLEIHVSMHENGREGTLISILDKTCTPMGSRLFKNWIGRPLRSLAAIGERLAAVKALVQAGSTLDTLRTEMESIGDIERLIARICAGRSGPRDIVQLQRSLLQLPRILPLLHMQGIPAAVLSGLQPLTALTDMIGHAISPDAPATTGSGTAFLPGYSPELDEVLEALYSGKNWIQEYQQRERDITGIPSLKISSNGVFGYYIEISNTHRGKIPEDRYERRQTLANAERYTTPELKAIESRILNAGEQIAGLEQKLFQDLCAKIIEYTAQVQMAARSIAVLDCLQSFATAARLYGYTEPVLEDSAVLEIKGGRHPVVERLLPAGIAFVPNSTIFQPDTERVHIITGPNMAGKSCYLRQTGLIVLLAQTGSFVPAESARIGIADRIFTRVGAQDNITAGESTFLVEMQEAANILNNATQRSLLLLDEVGRGTATFDGISIAWAIAEYVHDIIKARMLFATHYHELTDLTSHLEAARNYKVEVQEAGSTILFTHRVIPGTSDHSFGIHVAQMAGLPGTVIGRANQILATLEASSSPGTFREPAAAQHYNSSMYKRKNDAQAQFSMFEVRDDSIREKIMGLNLDSFTPLQAFRTLMELQEEIKKILSEIK